MNFNFFFMVGQNRISSLLFTVYTKEFIVLKNLLM